MAADGQQAALLKRTSSEMVRDSKHNILLGLVVASLICIILALTLSVSSITKMYRPPGYRYGMVFDARSTHTSLYLYRWPAGKEDDTGAVNQVHSCNVEGPGISSYASDPPQAGKSLKHCLDGAMDIIPVEKQYKTLAYLGATAGMRLLRLQNAAAAEKVLAEVSKTLKQYPFDFRGARILSGVEEGVYGWITLNYLLKSFIKANRFIIYEIASTEKGVKKLHEEFIQPAKPELFGALDLGADSAQISFIPNVEIQDKQEEAKFHLYGTNYTVYTHSYLCYGWKQALKQLLLQTIVGKNLMNPITNPCYPAGYKETILLRDLHDSPCTAPQPQEIDQPSGRQGITLVGNGDAYQCRVLLKKIFNFAACNDRSSCTFDGIYQPPVTGKFLAFGDFYTTFRFLNLTTAKSPETVCDSLKEFCSRSWAELKPSYPNEHEHQLRDYCGRANYIFSLLLDVYKFTQDTWTNITFQKQAANADIDWTLGYMLNLTNTIPGETADRVQGQDLSVWAAAIFFISLALVLSLIMLIIYLRC